MLKCNIQKKKGFVRVKAKGTPYELALETSAVIEDCYKNLHLQNPEAAAEYKRTMLSLVIAPGSPVWKEKNHD